MELFTMLLLKLLVLYVAIAMGYVAGRKLGVGKEGVGNLLFYLIVPLVFFHGVSKLRMEGEFLALPLIVMAMSCLLCLVFYAVGKRLFHDKTANLLALTSGNANIGYFGLPIAIILFDEQTVALYMVTIIGVMLYESTLGYYITAIGEFSARDAARKVLTVPMLHGSLAGIAMSLLGWQTPPIFEDFFVSLRGTYMILGLMMIGLGLAGLTSLRLDWRFTFLTFAVKFLAWPLLVLGFTWLDTSFLHLYGDNVHQAMLLMGVMPLAVNSVVMATILRAHPEKMAAAVFLSTVFALFYVPLMVALFIIP